MLYLQNMAECGPAPCAMRSSFAGKYIQGKTCQSLVCSICFAHKSFLYVSLFVAFIAVLFHFKSRYRVSPVRPLHHNILDILFLPPVQWLQSWHLQGCRAYPSYVSSSYSSQPHKHPLSSSDKHRHVEGTQIFSNVEVTFPLPFAVPSLLLAWASTAAPSNLLSAVQPARIAPTSSQPPATSLSLTPPSIQTHLSKTDGIELPKCGDKCCSLGYTCQGTMCAKDTSPTPSPSSPSTATPSPTTPASASQTSDCPASVPVETKSSFDGRSFVAGFFPGIVIGALSTLALIWVIKKRRESQAKNRYSGDFGHVARQISDPIYDPQLAARTDFMRRGSRSVASSPNSIDRIAQGMKETNNNAAVHGFTPRIKSMWERTPKLNFGFMGGLPANPAPPAVRAGNPYTDPYQTPPPKPKRIHSTRRSSRRTSAIPPHIQPQYPQGRSGALRTDSSETIDVLTPTGSVSAYPGNQNNDSGFLQPPKAPGMRSSNRYTADSGHTTFTQLMERAGFDEGPMQEVRDWKTPRV